MNYKEKLSDAWDTFYHLLVSIFILLIIIGVGSLIFEESEVILDKAGEMVEFESITITIDKD